MRRTQIVTKRRSTQIVKVLFHSHSIESILNLWSIPFISNFCLNWRKVWFEYLRWNVRNGPFKCGCIVAYCVPPEALRDRGGTSMRCAARVSRSPPAGRARVAPNAPHARRDTTLVQSQAIHCSGGQNAASVHWRRDWPERPAARWR